MRRLLVLAIVGLTLVATDRPLRNCMWFDHYPQGPYDRYRALHFGPEGWGYMVQAESSYKQHVEIFEFCEEAGRINFHFHHDNRRPTCPYRIEPAQDLRRLTLEDDPNGGRVYYAKLRNGSAARPAGGR